METTVYNFQRGVDTLLKTLFFGRTTALRFPTRGTSLLHMLHLLRVGFTQYFDLMMAGGDEMELWTDLAKKDAQVRLDQVERRRAAYRSKLAELDSEAAELSRFLSVVEKMGNEQYWKSLLDSTSLEDLVTTEEKLHALQADLRKLGRITPKDALPEPMQTQRFGGELPDLPAALGVSRQPDKSDTSYRIAAIMRLNREAMTYEDVWQEFKSRDWVDPSWTKPEAAVRQAMRRTVQYGWTKRIGSNVYIYAPSTVSSEAIQPGDGQRPATASEDESTTLAPASRGGEAL